VRIQHLEDDHVGAAIAEMLQPVDHLLRIVQQIGDEHDEAPLADCLDEVLQIIEGTE